MNRNDDLARTLETWLRREAPSQAPDRVLEIAMERVATESQRQTWGQRLFGDTQMTALLRAAALTAVIAIAVLVGLQLAGLFRNVGPQPSPSPSTTPLATPRAAAWSATESMVTPRAGHTATLLSDGTVLVAAGFTAGPSGGVSIGPLDSAQVYDLDTGVWTSTGTMHAARTGHTATLLSDGRVLVAGGSGPDGPLASAEIYDPASRTWTATGRMRANRVFHTATLLLDGRILLVGGGGVGPVPLLPVASAELYDPGTGVWTSTGTMRETREGHTATLLPDGMVLVTGGAQLASAELFDPASGTWTVTGNMTEQRAYHAATLLSDGTVLVTGGISGLRGPSATAELYDPGTAVWTATANMDGARNNHTATLLPDNRVLVSGLTQLYEPRDGTWTVTAAMIEVRYQHTATLLPDGSVLVVGGSNGDSVLASAERFDAGGGT